MCADMSRIEYKKDKGNSRNQSSNNRSTAKKQTISNVDCSSAQAFFNSLTQK